jgi:transposase InsO family protein
LRHVRTRIRSPQTNGVIERFFGTLKYEHLFRGRIDDGDALAVEINRIDVPRVLSIPDTDDVLVLDDAPGPAGYYQRVICRRPDGTVSWTAEPPTHQPGDAWTTIRHRGAGLQPKPRSN